MFTDQIINGMALLDSKVPDWRSKIDVDNLDMMTYDSCILGQVFGNFDRGLTELGISYEGAGRHGFCMAYSNYDELTSEWVSALKQ